MMITTKDLGALNELMTFENWIALKMSNFSKQVSSKELKKVFGDMAQVHIAQHEVLLNYLKTNSKKGGK